MALKGRNWLFGKCLNEERNRTRLSFLSAKVLDLGLCGRDRTQGHVLQACGATQVFLNNFSHHKRTIRGASPTKPYELKNSMRGDWVQFLSGQTGDNGRKVFNYKWDTLKFCLTR